MKSYPAMWGLFHKPLNKDPVIKQPGFNGKQEVLFIRGSPGNSANVTFFGMV